MSSSLPLQIAETIQTASLNTNPSVEHDLNPSTAASAKVPVTLASHHAHASSHSSYDEIDDDIDDDEIEAGIEHEDIPYEVLKPVPRGAGLGPLPDLRFEQSYLASLEGVESWWGVGGITVRDQIIMPLLQGLLWSLLPLGWRYWNRNATLSGASVGAKVRRWWYRTNNWAVPETRNDTAEKMGEFYQYQNQSAGD